LIDRQTDRQTNLWFGAMRAHLLVRIDMDIRLDRWMDRSMVHRVCVREQVADVQIRV